MTFCMFGIANQIKPPSHLFLKSIVDKGVNETGVYTLILDCRLSIMVPTEASISQLQMLLKHVIACKTENPPQVHLEKMSISMSIAWYYKCNLICKF